VRDTESPLLFNHSTRVYYFGSLAGKRRGLKFDAELLYIGAMFHDMGLTPRYSSETDRFEVDGANNARAFLRQHNISQQDIDIVWTAIALTHYPGYSTVHASGCCVSDRRRGDGCAWNRIR
jgi:HD superfamily phosphodiesterase